MAVPPLPLRQTGIGCGEGDVQDDTGGGERAGIGAGGAWPGPRLSPGQSISAMTA